MTTRRRNRISFRRNPAKEVGIRSAGGEAGSVGAAPELGTRWVVRELASPRWQTPVGRRFLSVQATRGFADSPEDARRPSTAKRGQIRSK